MTINVIIAIVIGVVAIFILQYAIVFLFGAISEMFRSARGVDIDIKSLHTRIWMIFGAIAFFIAGYIGGSIAGYIIVEPSRYIGLIVGIIGASIVIISDQIIKKENPDLVKEAEAKIERELPKKMSKIKSAFYNVLGYSCIIIGAVLGNWLTNYWR